MFGRKSRNEGAARKAAARSTIDTLIGASTRIDGSLSFRGGLRIDGQVSGDVVADDDGESLVVVGDGARIAGDVVATHLIVNGTVEGSLAIDGAVELQPKACVRGELRYRTLEIHSGAVVEAALTRIDGTETRPGLKLAASHDSRGRPSPAPEIEPTALPRQRVAGAD